MTKINKERTKEIKNFCTDLSVLWRKYAIDCSFSTFIQRFESYVVMNVSRGALFMIDDLNYIDMLREYCEKELS